MTIASAERIGKNRPSNTSREVPNMIVQSLWIGARLSVMEQLAIRSFLHHGHPFHLYTYEDVQDVPAGTIVRPGTEILPEREVFCYQRGYGKGSFSAFSNCFRYRLLLERGGWWADLDAVCLRPLDFPDAHVTGYEREPLGEWHVAAGLVKAPAGSPLIEYCWKQSQTADRARLRWGHIGPRLVARALEAVDTPVRILDPTGFYPIDHWQTWRLIRGRKIPKNCYSIHLWNSQWRREGFSPDAVYDPRSIYEQLKRKHGVSSPPDAPRGDPDWRKLVRCWRRQIMYGVAGCTVRCGGLARKRIPQRRP